MSLLGWELCSIGLASVCTLAVGAPAQLSLGYVCPCPTCPCDLAGGSCPAVGAPARLSPVQVSCLVSCPDLGGGSFAQLSPRSCVVWPWRWELCSIVASVLCRVGPWRWELCSIVALVDLVVIPTRIDACSRLDQKIFRRQKSDVCLSSFWKVCDNCLVVRWLSQ